MDETSAAERRASDLIEDIDDDDLPRLDDLVALIENYESIGDSASGLETRLTFLRTLREHPTLIRDDRVSGFLAEHVDSEDFGELSWDTPEDVVVFCEALFSIPFDDEEQAETVKADVNALLRHVLHRYEAEGDHEQMFVLLKYAPAVSMMSDAELFRLRHRSYSYELRRVQRNRRILYAYLVSHALLMFVVFPLLFVYAENGALVSEIEAVAKVDLPAEPAHQYTFADALYWSLVTAASIGYGDITPVTQIGRIMAAVLGLLGVITVGVIAGLILQWVTPRPLD